MFKMILNDINSLALKTFDIATQYEILTCLNDCKFYLYIGSQNIDIATKYAVFIYSKWLWKYIFYIIEDYIC